MVLEGRALVAIGGTRWDARRLVMRLIRIFVTHRLAANLGMVLMGWPEGVRSTGPT